MNKPKKTRLKVLNTGCGGKGSAGGEESRAYEADEYLKRLNREDRVGENVKVSNLEIPNLISDIVRRGIAGTIDNLRELQSGPFPIYNAQEHIGMNGLVPVVSNQMLPPAAPHVNPIIPPPNMAMVPQVAAMPQPAMVGQNGVQVQAIPGAMPVTATQGMDPNSPSVANVPIANVIGNKKIVAPGVIPEDVMDSHPIFTTKSLIPNKLSKLDFESMSRNLIIITIVIFLLVGCVIRIKSRKKPKNKR